MRAYVTLVWPYVSTWPDHSMDVTQARAEDEWNTKKTRKESRGNRMETLSFERWKFGHYFKLVERQEKKSDFELKDEPGADTSIH